MKTLLFVWVFLLGFSAVHAQDDGVVRTYQADPNAKPVVSDSIKLTVDSKTAYYQKLFKVDSSIKISTIYVRALQFMAAKNFQQNYGYEQEGKMIFTSTQDLNVAPGTSEPNENLDPYTVQFAFTIDMKNGRYRCTISNVVFFLPSDFGNRRMTLYEVYQKETSNESKRITRNAKSLIDSFERYLIDLTGSLNTEVEHKAQVYNSKF
jgi:hypothetical protein